MPTQNKATIEYVEFRYNGTRIKLSTESSADVKERNNIIVDRSSRGDRERSYFDITMPDGESVDVVVNRLNGSATWRSSNITLKRVNNTLIICYTHPED